VDVKADVARLEAKLKADMAEVKDLLERLVDHSSLQDKA
jgi:hypothetical protein